MLAAIVPVLTVVVAFAYLFYWVFRDAPAHGLDPYRWALVGVALPPVGLFVYLRRRAEASDELEDGDPLGLSSRR